MSYERIKDIEALKDFLLRVRFCNGVIKIYDCKPLLKKDAFKLLENESFFKRVKVDSGGYGIIWNDEIDLAESELWINGVTENTDNN
jgi:hypothetical protein